MQQDKCPNCGAPLSVAHAGIIKCEYCGKKLRARAAQTGRPEPPAPRPAEIRPAVVQPATTAPQAYVIRPARGSGAGLAIAVFFLLVSLVGGMAGLVTFRSTGNPFSASGSGGAAGPPRRIAFGETQRGVLTGPAITHQDYVLDVPAAAKVRIDMVGQGIDSHVDLLDARGGLLATDDDGGSGLDSKIEQVLPAGRYTVRAKLHSGSGSGPYGLSVTAFGTASGLARQVQVGTAASGVLGAGTSRQLGDGGAFFDEWAFSALAGQAVRVSVLCGSCQIGLVVEAESGFPVAGTAEATQYRQADALVAGMPAGTYVARVFTREASPYAGPYVVVVTDAAATAPREPGTTALAAGMVVYAELPARGRRGRSVHDYPLVVPAGPAPVPLLVVLSTEGNVGAAVHLGVEIVDPSGMVVATGTREGSVITAQAVLVPGVSYTVRVRGRSSGPGGLYMLAVPRPWS